MQPVKSEGGISIPLSGTDDKARDKVYDKVDD